MLTSSLITDLRKTLNEAQDYGQECLVWIRRAIKTDTADFEHEVEQNAIAAFKRAKMFLAHLEQTR